MSSDRTRTSGLYDPAAGPTYFLAGGLTSVEAITATRTPLLVATNELMNPNARDAFARVLEATDAPVLLDSGVFSICAAHSRAHGIPLHEVFSMRFEDVDGHAELWDVYTGLLDQHRDRLWGSIEIDLGGPSGKDAMRERIQREASWCPIPVFHPQTDPADYFDDLCQRYDRVAVGGIVQARKDLKKRLLRQVAERAHRYPGVWVHYLGVHVTELFCAIGPQGGSADSTKWLTPVKWTPAHMAFGMLRIFAPMPSELRFTTGKEVDESVSYRASLAVGAAQSHYAQESWRAWVRELDRAGLRDAHRTPTIDKHAL